MKILLSADCFFPAQMGGPSNTIYWLAKALTRAGHDVTVIATSQDLTPSVPLNQWVRMDCGRVMYTRNPHFYLPLRHIWQGWLAISHVNVVHVNSLFYPASLIWVLLSQWAGKPVIWSPHGELNPVALAVRPRLKRFILGLIKRILTPSIHFQAASKMEAGHIRDYFGKATSVVKIQSRMELPPLVQSNEATRLTSPYILFVGRLHPIKGIDNLLRALGASEVFRASEFSLIIAGPQTDSTYRNLLTELVKQLGLLEKVTFAGLVRPPWKESLYANARLTVLPSHAESFGNVVVESLAQGTPVVSSTNTPWQVLETKRAGRWVANDPESLREAVEEFLLMPPDAYHQYRQRAYTLAHWQFDVHEHVGEWEQVYREIVQRTNHTQNVVPVG
jgi:glycosyltransferase involved in cell wall biosynthesis